MRTAALLGLLSGILVLAGYYIVGNEQGLILGLIFAALFRTHPSTAARIENWCICTNDSSLPEEVLERK